MEKTVRICDICNKQIVNPEEFITVKCKSGKYVISTIQGDYGSNKKKFDICQDCVDKFRQFAKNPSSPNGVARWIRPHQEFADSVVCSNCDYNVLEELVTPYCPYCGRTMTNFDWI